MKQLLRVTGVLLLATLTACQQAGNQTVIMAGRSSPMQNTSSTDDRYPVMAFNEVVHDFGRITIGEKVEYSFKFRNTGSKDLVITSATSTCGCTVPEYPKEPIKPGREAYLKVVFNSAGKSEGYMEKPVYIMANTLPPQMILKIKCVLVNNESK